MSTGFGGGGGGTVRFTSSGEPTSGANTPIPQSPSFWENALGVAGAALPFIGPAYSLISGLFGESPEEQFQRAQQENLRRTVEGLTRSAALERAQLAKQAEKNRRFALSAGARRKAAVGYSGDSPIFANADLSVIDQNLIEGIDRVSTNEQRNILFAGMGQQVVPSYMFPDAGDYFTSALSSINRVVEDRSRVRQQQQEMEMILNALKA